MAKKREREREISSSERGLWGYKGAEKEEVFSVESREDECQKLEL